MQKILFATLAMMASISKGLHVLSKDDLDNYTLNVDYCQDPGSVEFERNPPVPVLNKKGKVKKEDLYFNTDEYLELSAE